LLSPLAFLSSEEGARLAFELIDAPPLDFGKWWVHRDGEVVAGSTEGLTLDSREARLMDPTRRGQVNEEDEEGILLMPTNLQYHEAREILDKIDEIGAADPDVAMKYLDRIEQIYDSHGLNVSPIARAREAMRELDAALGSIFADCEVVGAAWDHRSPRG